MLFQNISKNHQFCGRAKEASVPPSDVWRQFGRPPDAGLSLFGPIGLFHLHRSQLVCLLCLQERRGKKKKKLFVGSFFGLAAGETRLRWHENCPGAISQ